MAGVKISNLPVATLPLSGTEAVAVVQSGVTVQTPSSTINPIATVGLLKGTGTAVVAATAGTDYVAPGGALGTPSSGVATNLTGTANALTAGFVGAGTTLPVLSLGGTVSGNGNQINNVIIGTTTPLAGSFTQTNISTKELIGGPTSSSYAFGLQLYGTATNGSSNALQWQYSANTVGATLLLAKTRGSTTTDLSLTSQVAINDILGSISWGGSDGFGALISAASVSAINDSAASSGTVPTALNFSTGTTTGVSRMKIASTGVVTMSNYGAGTATFSAAGVISSVSDETLKIKDGVIADPMPMIMALEPGYYFGKPEANMGDGRQLGFYAQNVRSAIGPEAAPDPESSTLEDGTVVTKPWGYFDRSVLAVAIEAIKVLTARIAALEAK
tara:strand:- start:12 stop:1175 length:1164 start_codon:yes stop_codon:yes gene_type:complete